MIAGLYDIFNHWHEQGTCWLISDTHFNDQELYVGTQHVIRANSEDYVKLINSKVGKNDTLIHLGDVGHLDAVRRLRGRKILVMGNHDAGASNYKRKIYEEIFDSDVYDRKQVIKIMKEKYPNCRIRVSDEPFYSFKAPFTFYAAAADNGLFDEVYTGPLFIGERLLLSHEPIHGIDSVMNIHGHVHDPKAKDNATHLNICPDATGNFEPINFNRLMKTGFMSRIEGLHRKTINRATERKKGKK